MHECHLHFPCAWSKRRLSMLINVFGIMVILCSIAAEDLRMLRIYHQNDIHSHYDKVLSSLEVCPKDKKRHKCYGGFARAVYFIRDQKKYDNILNVNAGDFFQGHIYYTLFGWEMAGDIVSRMSFDGIALGNHEFYSGLEALAHFIQRSRSNFVCTNLDFSQVPNRTLGTWLHRRCPPSRIARVTKGAHADKTRIVVGVLGYTSPDTALHTDVGGVIFRDEVETLNSEIANMRAHDKNLRVFVAVGHSGLRRDLEIARQVSSLDVVVGGHSHTMLWDGVWQPWRPMPPTDRQDNPDGVYPIVVVKENGRTVLVVQSYMYGKYLGGIDIGFNRDGEVRDWWPNQRLLTDRYKEDFGIRKVLEYYDRKLAENMTNVVGHTRVKLDGRSRHCYHAECNFGNMFADAVLWVDRYHSPSQRLPVNIALVVSSSFRQVSAHPPGAITLAQVLQTLPHRNTFTVVNMSADTLLGVLENSVSAAQGDGRFLQVSGVRVVYNVGMPAGSRVQSVSVLCGRPGAPRYVPVHECTRFEVALTTDMAMGRDNYTMITASNPNLGASLCSKRLLDIDIMLEYLKAFSPVYPSVEGRIVKVNELQSDGHQRYSAGPTLLLRSLTAVACFLVLVLT